MNCYCCSDKEFEDCCQPLLDGSSQPTTAEELMRSRYSAYATGAIDYIVRSTHPSSRKYHDVESVEEWAASSTWQKLEIIAKSAGEAKDKRGLVEFKAYYLDAEKSPQIHHEISHFEKYLGKWFFVNGRVL